LKPAAYRDIRSAEVAYYRDDVGNEARLIAGEMNVGNNTLNGCLPAMATRPLLADVSVASGAEFILDVGDYERVLVFVYAGDSTELKTRQLGVYGTGDKLTLRAGEQGFEALVLAGEALREPIVQHGPFVMNQPEEIEQAIRDFKEGRLVTQSTLGRTQP
jgi:hypothetical protein